MGALLHTGRSAAAPPTKVIAAYYDEYCGLCERMWGDHAHLGFYEPGATASFVGHRDAQLRMMEEALSFAGVSDEPLKRPRSIVDVGCGIGGCARYLSKKYGAKCEGITISPVEAERAQALTAAQGLADEVTFQVADAHEQPFPDEQFDLAWSMMSAELMHDKRKFMSELARVTAPGGTIIIATLCPRELLPSEDSLRPEEWNILRRIGDAHHFPTWWAASDYVKTAQSLGLQDIKSANWSENVAPFWSLVTGNRYTWQVFVSIFLSGWKTIKSERSLMIESFGNGLLNFSIITCRKPGIREERRVHQPATAI